MHSVKAGCIVLYNYSICSQKFVFYILTNNPFNAKIIKNSEVFSMEENNVQFEQQTNQPYQQPVYSQQPQYNPQPVGQLKTNRSLAKYILLSLITFGIYGLVVMCGVSTDINTVAQRYDGQKTTHYALVFFVFSWLTLGIYPIVWMHKLSNRLGSELKRRGIDYTISASDFWLWGVLGCLIIVGPFIYYHKLFNAMNLINTDYNARG